MRVLIVVVLAVLVAVGGVLAWRGRSPAPVEQETLYLAVPMGIFVPMNFAMEQFRERHPHVRFSTMIDTPEMMVEAVEENDEKPDIFISPGGREAMVLVEMGLLDPDTMVAFGSYEVAILVPKGNPGQVKEPADLLNPEVQVISFSPPDLNAASHAARQALRNMGLWDQIEHKVHVTGCCNESFQWVVKNRAEANVQFVGCPMDTKAVDLSQQQAEIACIFPRDTYYVPRNVAGIIATTTKRKLAEEFLAFLTSPRMIEMMAERKLRNDQELPLSVGPWGPAQEAGPVEVAGS